MYQIFVAESDMQIRQDIRDVIEGLSGPYAFCGEAPDGEMALSIMQELMPDILLTDIHMPFLDGFELIRHAKAMLPWLKVGIISDRGDFESAQKAIALGVDQYLLKPFQPPELVKAIEEMAARIEADKRQRAVSQIYGTDEVQHALRQHFMQQLLYGGLHTSTLIERAHALNLDVVSPCYQLALCSFGPEELDYGLLQVSVRNILARLNMPLYYFNESHQLTVLFDGRSKDALSESVYQFISILRHELKELSPTITTVVSNTVQQLSAVSQAYRTAADLLRKVYVFSQGQVVDVSDAAQIAAERIELGNPFGPEFQQKLQHVSLSGVQALVDEMLQGPEGNPFNSTLMRYYALIDLLKMTVQQVVKFSPGLDAKDVAARLSSEYDVMAASVHLDTFRQAAVNLLRRAVLLREESLSTTKYSHVISKAEKYVAEHFCDPGISLISVAKYVGLSAAHFSTVFSQTTGRSFINHLTSMRIERAKKLLTFTNMKLSTIAMEIGYNEPNYFSHVFRKSEGIAPKEYRNLTRDKHL